MPNIQKLLLTGSVIIAIGFSGCAQPQQEQSVVQEETTTTDYSKAVAVVHPTEGNNASGTVTFEQTTNDSVRVIADITGLEQGKHGFHIHQYGDCTASDGTSAGGHYNPENNDHGSPTQDNRHMGDMGNLTADSEGNATLEYTDSHIVLNGPDSIIGRGVVVHGGEDDFSSQPSGDAGPRLGCGVIGIANTE